MTKLKSKDKTILIFSIAIFFLMIVNIILFIRVIKLENQINKMFAPEESGLNIGEKVKDFNLLGVNEKEVSLKDLNDKKLLLIFTTVGCSPCVELYDDIKEFEEKHKEINIAIIVNGPLENIKKITEDYNFSSKVLNDSKNLTINAYKVNGFPFANLIDENNILISKGFVNNINDLENLLNIAK